MSLLDTWVRNLLAHPLARGIDLDGPHCTQLRRQVLREKRFLRRLYVEWYKSIAAAVPKGGRPVVELGSGAGFLYEFIPGLVTSDVLHVPEISLVLDGHQLPFRTGSLRAIVMIDVLHHLCRPRDFLREAARCIESEGALIMIEPWVSPWSEYIYTRLHHEPFDSNAEKWEFPPSGPLSGANGAIPWMIFQRDANAFREEFPQWHIKRIAPETPFGYLLSGGMSMRALAPGWALGPVRAMERLLRPMMHKLAMFAQIELHRTDAAWCGT